MTARPACKLTVQPPEVPPVTTSTLLSFLTISNPLSAKGDPQGRFFLFALEHPGAKTDSYSALGTFA